MFFNDSKIILSMELLQQGEIDLLILVVTEKGPDPNFILNSEVERYQNRILGLFMTSFIKEVD